MLISQFSQRPSLSGASWLACPTAICTVCGKPRERIVERTREHGLAPDGFPKTDALDEHDGARRLHRRLKAARNAGEPHDNALGGNATLGWSDCGHNSWEPGLVLDPFSGAGTTAMVAQQLGRRAVGVDLSAAYTAMAIKRLEAIPLPMELLP